MLRLYDMTLEYRYEHGGTQDNYGKGLFTVFAWNSLSELEQAPIDPAAYEWTDWLTASSRPEVALPGGDETEKAPDPPPDYYSN